ncbi:acetolactate synthase 2 catalytic subunit [Marinihelvus fidelis]|uniref:Acetolactate synthase n=1 Tax=Marinihelvus fidelis TaxID=2613842 RepID=A0A5N0TFZ5_9GAMM|nr:acetolactate synthase 2 catalytic subunit [Marinihelvus fidelis]KAA9133995.1 acetolactate synthase 2 catalytic subunit [Marinihelvus fidelis]
MSLLDKREDTSAEPLTGSQLMIEALKRNGVKEIFGYPGGAIMPLYDALVGSGLKHYLTRHEQGASLAADAYGRVTRRAGVCMATSGPGATNLVTGIANAYMDSVPMVAITGQVASSLIGTDAFQEVDIFGITLPVVKHSFVVRDVSEIPEIMDEAFRIAEGGRPGPVLVDFPKDVSVATHSPSRVTRHASPKPAPVDEAAITAANELLAKARRPLVIAGGGIAISDAIDAFRDFVERTGLPVTATLKSLGSLPTDHERFLGMLGMHGNEAANHAVQNCDLLMVIGGRFDDRVTGKLTHFAPTAQVIHMDIDPAEVSKLRKPDVAIVGELAPALEKLGPAEPPRASWINQCEAWKKEFAWRYDAPGEGIYAPKLLRDMSRMRDDLVVACDVGQHQMWVAQHCRFNDPLQHLTSGGLGTMGYGLPAAMGAKVAKPEAKVVAVCGDGSFMMNVQELATLNRYGIDVRILLLNNAMLGMVRQWQELFFEGNYSEVDLSDNPDFARVAEAFGLISKAIDKPAEVDGGLEWLLADDGQGPRLLHVRIDPMENVWPLVPPGQANHKMMGNR